MKNFAIWLSILCIPLYGFWTIPQWDKLKEKNAKIFLLERNLSTKKEEINNLNQLQAELDQSASDSSLQQIPLNMNQDLVMMDLKSIAESSGFVFDGFSFSESKDPELKINTLNISFNLKGKKERLPLFFKKMEDNKRFLSTDSLSASMTEINGVSVIQFGTSIKSYFQ